MFDLWNGSDLVFLSNLLEESKMSWKQVWAAAYAHEFTRRIESPPTDVVKSSGDLFSKWMTEQALYSADYAYLAVVTLKDAIPLIQEACGASSEVTVLAKRFVCPDLKDDENE
jgi:hypothetical protein